MVEKFVYDVSIHCGRIWYKDCQSATIKQTDIVHRSIAGGSKKKFMYDCKCKAFLDKEQ